MLAVLPAFGYLHNQGLLYCDFKPDNAIQTDEQLTLIDLGGVVAMGEESDLFGTVGYQAPEVPDVGASINSDLYTVGRTLAVLSFDFAGFQDKKRYATSLPPVNEVPLFGRYEAFYEFLVKATAPDPASRFQSAEEMGEQLIGVLRQVRAIDGKDPGPLRACFSVASSAMRQRPAAGRACLYRRSTPSIPRPASWRPSSSRAPSRSRLFWLRHRVLLRWRSASPVRSSRKGPSPRPRPNSSPPRP